MLNPKDFVKKLETDSEDLYRAAELKVKEFWDGNPSPEKIVNYFSGRLINERGNCTEIAKRVANLPNETSPEEMFLLCKQAMDEAKHFRLVKEIIEHFSGEPVDLDEMIAKHEARTKSEGKIVSPAQIMQKYETSTDPLAIAIYQYIGEGRAARNWDMMADCATDPLVQKHYKEIAKDEYFHSKIGRNKLLELVVDEETQQRAEALAEEFRDDLWVMGGCVKQHKPAGAMA